MKVLESKQKTAGRKGFDFSANRDNDFKGSEKN